MNRMRMSEAVRALGGSVKSGTVFYRLNALAKKGRITIEQDGRNKWVDLDEVRPAYERFYGDGESAAEPEATNLVKIKSSPSTTKGMMACVCCREQMLFSECERLPARNGIPAGHYCSTCAPYARGCTREDAVLVDLLGLVMHPDNVPDVSQIQNRWTDLQCLQAQVWAATSHYSASDHEDVRVIDMPPFLKKMDRQQYLDDMPLPASPKAVESLAAMAKPNELMNDDEFARSYIKRYMPPLLATVIQRVPPDVLVDILARFMSRAVFRDVLEKELKQHIDSADDAWWQMRVCQICLKGVDLG